MNGSGLTVGSNWQDREALLSGTLEKVPMQKLLTALFAAAALGMVPVADARAQDTLGRVLQELQGGQDQRSSSPSYRDDDRRRDDRGYREGDRRRGDADYRDGNRRPDDRDTGRRGAGDSNDRSRSTRDAERRLDEQQRRLDDERRQIEAERRRLDRDRR